MRLARVVVAAIIAAIATSHTPRALPDSRSLNLGRGDIIPNAPDFINHLPLPLAPELAAPAADIEWDKVLATGSKLQVTLPIDDRLASWYWKTDPHHSDPNLQTVQSPFDGDMKDLFRRWGYNEPPEEVAKIDKECDFDAYHKLKRAFEELGIGTKSKGQGGPNECVQIDHSDGPAVLRDDEGVLPPMAEQKYVDATCGKEYRITGATYEFALNSEAGMITLINVISASYSAKRLWGKAAQTHELPQVRSTSDIAWGLWNRASGGDVKKIKYLMTAMIMNTETRDVIREAHASLEPKRSETAVWPGYDFPTTEKAGQALMGTSVGRWAGYFLLQHKAQLGNKYISKVRVFKPDGGGSMPYMLFYVAGPGAAAGDEDLSSLKVREMSTAEEERIFASDLANTVSTRGDGKNFLREHVIRIE